MLCCAMCRAAPQEVIDELLAASGQKAPAAAAAAAATVPQLSSQADLQAACLDKGGVCILALLPPQPAEQQQAEQGEGEGAEAPSSAELTTLRHVAQQRALAAGDAVLPLHFAWVDAVKFPAFARALGVAEPGEAPAVVALAPRKRRFAVMGGPLLPDVLDRFVSGLLSGQVTTAPLQVRWGWLGMQSGCCAGWAVQLSGVWLGVGHQRRGSTRLK